MREVREDLRSAPPAKDDSIWRDLAAVGQGLSKVYTDGERAKQEAQEKALGTGFTIVEGAYEKGKLVASDAEKEISAGVAEVKREGSKFGDDLQKRWDRAMDDLNQINPFADEASKAPRIGCRPSEKVSGVPSREKPAEKTAEAGQLEKRSDAIFEACKWHGNDNGAVFRALADTTLEQRQKMDKDFHAKHGQHLEEYLRSEMKRHPEMRDQAISMLKDKGKVAYHEYDPSVYGPYVGPGSAAKR